VRTFFARLMYDMTQSCEVLEMMDATTTFGRKNDCTISWYSALFLGAFFLFSLIITGVMVYYFAPCLEKKQVQCTGSGSFLENEGSSPIKKNSDIRLPKAVVPDLYELWLIPFIWEGNFTFHGEVILLNLNIFCNK